MRGLHLATVSACGVSRRRARVELGLAAQIAAVGLPVPVLEHPVCAGRRFRFDLAWPDHKLACEVDGATWTHGRHTRGAGVERDCEKFSLAAIDGWCLLRVTTQMVRSGMALSLVERALTARGATIGWLGRPRSPTPPIVARRGVSGAGTGITL